ncbi:MAG: hypothetical protein AMXMBFR77_20410 [Phycisphaerales bacterium]|nr:MAG: hypothetical protein BroJett004_18710 [Planctomycetota bacterium]
MAVDEPTRSVTEGLTAHEQVREREDLIGRAGGKTGQGVAHRDVYRPSVGDRPSEARRRGNCVRPPGRVDTRPMPPDPTQGRLTRNDVITLGRSGRPWEFLPIALQALEVVPSDAGIRFLAAANFARLGLITPAREMLDALPQHAQGDSDVADLRRAMNSLPDDRVPHAERLETCRDNAAAIRGTDLAAAMDEWARSLPRWDCFRAIDGNIVRRRRDARGASAWVGLSDQRTVAARFAQAQLSKLGLFPRPLAIEGMDPPWVFIAVYDGTPPNVVGYRPRVCVLQADPAELLDGLSVCDLRDRLADPRVAVYAGADGVARFERDAGARLDVQVVPAFVPLHVVRTRFAQPPTEAFARLTRAQAAEFERVRDEIGSVYAGRDAVWWARRWGEARRGGRPLRVLIPTSRYSTFVRHAAEGLARCLRNEGCRVQVLAEPDPCAILTTVSVLRAVRDLEPDLIVIINYTRSSSYDGLLPANVPLVCWVQDALPHLFDRRVGEAMGPLDFVAGHVHASFIEKFGYPRERTLPSPVAADESKFHAGPVEPSLLREHECEIAYATHQSEPPDALHARLVADAAREGATTTRLFEAAWPMVRAAAAHPLAGSLVRSLRLIAERAVRETFGRDDDTLSALLRHQYVMPIAERIVRHQAAHWAAEVCARRGWRFRLYGKGWDKHPTLTEFARGELEHGDALRASYRAAVAHLHVSPGAIVHQRVMECALSGGVALCRMTADAVAPLRARARAELVERGVKPVAQRDDAVGFAWTDSPAALAACALMQRIGMEPGPCFWIGRGALERTRRGQAREVERESDPAWLLGDPAALGFASPDELERRIEAFIERPDLRAAWSALVAGRVRARCTQTTFARRMLRMVADSLGAENERDLLRVGERAA